jgi:hypothetical protein
MRFFDIAEFMVNVVKTLSPLGPTFRILDLIKQMAYGIRSNGIILGYLVLADIVMLKL